MCLPEYLQYDMAGNMPSVLSPVFAVWNTTSDTNQNTDNVNSFKKTSDHKVQPLSEGVLYVVDDEAQKAEDHTLLSQFSDWKFH